jgi:four helix bundle protein
VSVEAKPQKMVFLTSFVGVFPKALLVYWLSLATSKLIMYRLEELEVYKLAQVFSDKVWTIVTKWDAFAKFGLGQQFTKAADSISSNIAEGYGRYFVKDNIRFCYYSRGSVLECKNWLQKSRHRNLLPENEFHELIIELELTHFKLNGYIKLLRTNLKKQGHSSINQ